MNDYKYFDDLNIELIDGDRGKNYPRNDEMFNKGYCLFLNAKNVTINGFAFDENVFITKEKDELLRKGKLNRNDIVLTTRGTIGNVGLYDESVKYDNVRINSGMLIIRNSDSNINTKYLYYQLISPFIRDQIFSLKTGSAQPQIPIIVLKKLKLLIPDKNIQDKIVKVMDSVVNKIRLNNEINDNLLEICNCIFHNFLERNKDNVVYKKITDIAKNVITGKTPSTSNNQFWNGNIPFITIPDMHNQVFTIETERYITKLGAKSLIPKNSISVSCIATIGLVSISTEESQTNQQINSIIIDKDYDLYYLYEYLSEQADFMKSIAGGSTTYNINKNMFENMEVPYLPNDEMTKFNNNVSGMFERILENEKENKALEQLRDTLLPKLMNGEIDLENVEI